MTHVLKLVSRLYTPQHLLQLVSDSGYMIFLASLMVAECSN